MRCGVSVLGAVIRLLLLRALGAVAAPSATGRAGTRVEPSHLQADESPSDGVPLRVLEDAKVRRSAEVTELAGIINHNLVENRGRTESRCSIHTVYV